MKVHIRLDSYNKVHSKATIFVNGKNCGQLVMSPDELDWFYLILQTGCSALSPKGMLPIIEFVGSGHHKPDAPIPPVPQT